MNYRQMSSNVFLKKGLYLGLQPAMAWIAILALVFFSALCLLVNAGSLLRIVFPVGSLAVGVLLYLRYPVLYISFTWWLWFLSPLLARLVDYRSGFSGQLRQLIILSPYLVTALTIATFLRHLPKEARQGGLPFVLAFTGVFYSFLVGLIHYSSGERTFMQNGGSLMTIGVAVLSWLPSICFGFHLFVNWRDYPKYRQNIQRTFCWGVLVMGVYGVLQYLVAPPWDRLWFKNAADLQYCCGWPEPFMIRVWSTLNYPFTFAYFMMAALLLLLSSQQALRIPAALVGYLAFLLSTVRSAWGGWFVGLLIFITSLKPRFQVRLLVAILIFTVCIYPLTSIEPFSSVINSRFQSFSNIKQDHSLDERSQIYAERLDSTISEGLGNGMGGGKIVDAGILDILSTLGWFGIIPYIGGVVLILFNVFQYAEVRSDPFMNAARAIIVSIVVALPASNTMVLLPGVVFWGFSGMAMAAHKYHCHQRHESY